MKTQIITRTSKFDQTHLVIAGLLPIFFLIICSYSSQAQDFEWVKGIESNFSVNTQLITTDGNGNIYIAGRFNGTVDFDPGIGTTNLTGVRDTDMFFAKYNSNGDLVWAKSLVGDGTGWINSIVVDDNDNVYLAGYFSKIIDFDPGTGTTNLISAGSNGYSDIFYAKYDRNGDLVWVKKVGGTGYDQCYSMTLDNAGNIYITGETDGNADFDPGPGITLLDRRIVFAKYDNNGDLVWAKNLNSGIGARGKSIKVDARGNIYLAGFFSWKVDFDGDGTYNASAVGGDDIFLAKYGPNGDLAWAKSMGGERNDYGLAVEVDDCGNVYFTGRFAGDQVSFDGTLLSSNGLFHPDVVFAKYDSNGNLAWVKNVGGTDFDSVDSFVLDNKGNIYLYGRFSGMVDFDPGPGTTDLTSAASTDEYFVKYDADGNFLWVRQITGARYPSIRHIDLDSYGNIYLTGSSTNKVDFDPHPTNTAKLTFSGLGGSAIAKYSQPTHPEINLTKGMNCINSGNTFDFGNQAINTSSANQIFTIKNQGTADLTLSGSAGNLVTLNGTDASAFTITQTGVASPMSAGSSNIFEVRFIPSKMGVHNATLTITSNDADEGTYTINLTGTAKNDQTITFGNLASKTFGDTDFNLGASSSSGLAVIYSSSNTAVATISGNTVTIVGAGTTTITASQVGDANYIPVQKKQTLTINKADQIINFDLGANATKKFNEAFFRLSATGGTSGNLVSFTSSNTSVATISGNWVIIKKVGTTTITASQTGNANYNAASNVNQVLTVNKANQIIYFDLGANATKKVGDTDFDLSATASSSLTVTYTSSDASVATISGKTVTIVGEGTTTITASQAGNTNYNAASDKSQILTINNKTGQVITFDLGTNATKKFGDPDFTLSATGGSSGNPVTFTSSDLNVATISGNKVTIVGAGTTTITASQTGNANHNAAQDITQTLTVLASSVTGLPTNLSSGKMTLYPNPVGKSFTLYFSGNTGFGAGKAIKIVFYNGVGQVIRTINGVLDNSGKTRLFISDLSTGTYTIVITLPNGIQIQRRIVKK